MKNSLFFEIQALADGTKIGKLGQRPNSERNSFGTKMLKTFGLRKDEEEIVGTFQPLGIQEFGSCVAIRMEPAFTLEQFEMMLMYTAVYRSFIADPDEKVIFLLGKDTRSSLQSMLSQQDFENLMTVLEQL